MPVADIDALIAAGDLVGQADTLTLARLTTLHGLATLCHGLQIDAAALLRWQAVLGVAPFTPALPLDRADSLLQFIARFDSATATGLSLDAWDYLLRHALHQGLTEAEDRLRAGLDTVRSACAPARPWAIPAPRTWSRSCAAVVCQNRH